MRFAYADPPYLGQALRHYRDGGTAKRKLERDLDAVEVDHAELVARLNLYDGWALSCSTPSHGYIWVLCAGPLKVWLQR